MPNTSFLEFRALHCWALSLKRCLTSLCHVECTNWFRTNTASLLKSLGWCLWYQSSHFRLVELFRHIVLTGLLLNNYNGSVSMNFSGFTTPFIMRFTCHKKDPHIFLPWNKSAWLGHRKSKFDLFRMKKNNLWPAVSHCPSLFRYLFFVLPFKSILVSAIRFPNKPRGRCVCVFVCVCLCVCGTSEQM